MLQTISPSLSLYIFFLGLGQNIVDSSFAADADTAVPLQPQGGRIVDKRSVRKCSAFLMHSRQIPTSCLASQAPQHRMEDGPKAENGQKLAAHGPEIGKNGPKLGKILKNDPKSHSSVIFGPFFPQIASWAIFFLFSNFFPFPVPCQAA